MQPKMVFRQRSDISVGKLRHTTIIPWVKKYEQMLRDPLVTTIGVRRGRPTYLSAELDQKVCAMIINLRTAGSEINIYVVKGVLTGLIWSNITKYGAFLDFPVTRSWVRSLYGRMKFSRRASTTSRPTITRSVWEEAKEKYLHNIASEVSEHNIPNELILNADQTPSKYVSTSKVTMAETGKKNVPISGGADKRMVTLTAVQSLQGKILPFQSSTLGKPKDACPRTWGRTIINFCFLLIKATGATDRKLCV